MELPGAVAEDGEEEELPDLPERPYLSFGDLDNSDSEDSADEMEPQCQPGGERSVNDCPKKRPPQGQDDDSVNRCPGCETEFSFFFRKHVSNNFPLYLYRSVLTDTISPSVNHSTAS